ncbi:MAG: hypothetical protein QNJ15_12390 [Erythrobacter sp.]|nr:hypothetical protein [Erythrobacter sp.]
MLYGLGMFRLPSAFVFAFLASLFASSAAAQGACEPPGDQPSQSNRNEDGKSCFVFAGWEGPDIPVWLYVPRDIDRTTARIAIIMHGARRDPDRYRNEWSVEADKRGFIVVAPGFSRTDFPRANGYNLGAMRDPESGEWRDDARWSFTAIEPIFDAVVARIGGSQAGYTIYGHSAGSQFVHRSLFFRPSVRAKRYLAANAGWYTFPDLETPYPFGLGDTMLGKDDLRAALARDVVILLGDRDIDPESSSLNRSDGAMEQGPHRFARGKAFFAAARALAQRNGWQFGWSLRVVEGVAHSNGDMAAKVSDLIE